MALYTCTGVQVSASALGIVGWAVNGNQPSARRAYVYDFMVGADGTPADNVYRLGWTRYGAAIGVAVISSGTYTATTPSPLDPDWGVSVGVGASLYTAAPSITTAPTNLMSFGLNQRATFRWVAAPGSELVAPAVQDNSVVLTQQTGALAAPNVSIVATAFVREG